VIEELYPFKIKAQRPQPKKKKKEIPQQRVFKLSNRRGYSKSVDHLSKKNQIS